MTSDQCMTCKHYRTGRYACAAFPDGIPEEIFTGEVDHDEPYPGDGGIQWESALDPNEKPRPWVLSEAK